MGSETSGEVGGLLRRCIPTAIVGTEGTRVEVTNDAPESKVQPMPLRPASVVLGPAFEHPCPVGPG